MRRGRGQARPLRPPQRTGQPALRRRAVRRSGGRAPHRRRRRPVRDRPTPWTSKVGGYSTGMKTRLALARSILHDPDLLLLDEPTSGLDPESSHAVLALIDELAASGKTVVMSTHLLLEAEGLADQVVMMEDGRRRGGGPARGAGAPVLARSPPSSSTPRTAPGSTRLAGLDGVVDYDRNGTAAVVTVDDLARVPELVAALVAGGRAAHRGDARAPVARAALPEGAAGRRVNRHADVDHRPHRPPPAAPEPRLLGADAGAWPRLFFVVDPDLPAAGHHPHGQRPSRPEGLHRPRPAAAEGPGGGAGRRPGRPHVLRPGRLPVRARWP